MVNFTNQDKTLESLKKKPFVNDISVANSHFFEKYPSRKGQFKILCGKNISKD